VNSCWSLKTLFVASVGILLLTVALGGCYGGSEKATVGGTIKGYVTEINLTGLTDEIEPSVSGHGVPRASVSLIGTDKVSTTNNRGEFTFSNVASGTYDLLAKKDGWASAMAYEAVAEVNKATEVILYMTKPEDASEIKESIPPTVFLSCSRSIIQGIGRFSVKAYDAGGIERALLFIDDLCEEVFQAEAGKSTYMINTVYEWDTEEGWDDGEYTITLVVVDKSGNAGSRSIKVTVNNSLVPEPPINLMVFPITIHDSVYDLLDELDSMDTSLSASSSPVSEILSLARRSQYAASSRVKPLEIPGASDAVGLCLLTWQLPESAIPAAGFNIYRNGEYIDYAVSWDPSIDYPILDRLPIGLGGIYLDEGLTPGTEVSYSVSSCNSAGKESEKSAPVAATLMDALDAVSLLCPEDGGDEVFYPIFEWMPVDGAKLYLITVMDEEANAMWIGYTYTQEDEAWIFYGDPLLTLFCNPSHSELEDGETYMWFVLAIDCDPEPPAALISSDGIWIPERLSISASELWEFTYWDEDFGFWLLLDTVRESARLAGGIICDMCKNRWCT